MRALRALPVLLFALALPGCGHWLEMVGNSAGLDSPAKLVDTKVPPDLLVASDGSECRVPRSRFDHIQAGDVVTCVWTHGERPDPGGG